MAQSECGWTLRNSDIILFGGKWLKCSVTKKKEKKRNQGKNEEVPTVWFWIWTVASNPTGKSTIGSSITQRGEGLIRLGLQYLIAQQWPFLVFRGRCAHLLKGTERGFPSDSCLCEPDCGVMAYLTCFGVDSGDHVCALIVALSTDIWGENVEKAYK